VTPAASLSIAGSLNGHPVVPLAESNDRTPSEVAQLTHRLAWGDEAAFREFHARYFDRLYHFLLAVTHGEAHAAQDALQETLLRVARYARRFEDEEIFWSWLKAVARSAARDGNRKHRRYLARLRDFALGGPALFADERPNEPDHLRSLLTEALSDLSPPDRLLVEGKYFRGDTVAELAAQTGLTGKAVESRLGRLRQQLGASVRKKLHSS
jgi:RNA polymerase sigma-70 factor, ECF subfamily